MAGWGFRCPKSLPFPTAALELFSYVVWEAHVSRQNRGPLERPPYRGVEKVSGSFFQASMKLKGISLSGSCTLVFLKKFRTGHTVRHLRRKHSTNAQINELLFLVWLIITKFNNYVYFNTNKTINQDQIYEHEYSNLIIFSIIVYFLIIIVW